MHQQHITLTNRALYPKADPLRKYPETSVAQLHALKEKREMIVQGEKVIKERVVPGKVQQFSVQAKPASRATFVLEANGTDNDFSLALVHVTVEKDAHFHFVPMMVGGSRTECHVKIELKERGAEALVSGAFVGEHEQHQGFHIVMEHAAPDTKGDILIHAVYRGKARGVISGLIKIAKNAQKTNSYFSDHVLLMDDALAESEPTLEIEANDVRATHGSTTSRINDEQLFYIQSRGIDPEQARQLIVQGFLEKVMERVPTSLQLSFRRPEGGEISWRKRYKQ